MINIFKMIFQMDKILNLLFNIFYMLLDKFIYPVTTGILIVTKGK